MNPLIELQAYGQSFWYDNIRRKFLRDGSIQRLINEDGLRGITANPSIFAKAIENGDEYGAQINALVSKGADPEEIYKALMLSDIQLACDLFSDIFKQSGGTDGFVSLEVSPHLSDRTKETVDEAHAWFAAVARPNLMIKVPATAAGIPAIRQLISEGINVNITLMFSMAHYEAVVQAYLDGLAHFMESGGDGKKVASVASYFVSRVDTVVDRKLAVLNDSAAELLKGRIAVANSKLVYQRFKEVFLGAAFDRLRAAGGSPQRLLWASTSTKNPEYPDTMYVDELIGPQTINTMTPSTIDAYRDHGHPGNTLEEGIEEAQLMLNTLAALGINLDDVTDQLQENGIKSFTQAYDQLIAYLNRKAQTTVVAKGCATRFP